MEKRLKSVLDAAGNLITPSEEEINSLNTASARIIQKLDNLLKPHKARTVVAGSSKKNTYLKGTTEVDVFAAFNYKKHHKTDQQLSETLEKILKKNFKKTTKLHGSRDYFQIEAKPYIFEIVPILDISSARQAKNITDVSPLHAKWVTKNYGKASEIRLTKAFAAAQGVYGAESHIRGFSGYACELLTIHYKSFAALLKAAARWKEKEVIDPTRHYRNKNPLLELNKSKTESPIILIDPVQPERNATAALDRQAFQTFKKAAGDFLKNPSIKFFEKKEKTKSQLISEKGNNKLLMLEIEPHPNKKDVMGAAVRNKYELVKGKLEQHGFKTKKSGWQWNGKAILWFIVDGKPLPTHEERKGPKTGSKEHATRFRRKHKKAYVKKGRLYARARRKFATPQKLIRSLIREKRFKNKIKSVKTEWR